MHAVHIDHGVEVVEGVGGAGLEGVGAGGGEGGIDRHGRFAGLQGRINRDGAAPGGTADEGDVEILVAGPVELHGDGDVYGTSVTGEREGGRRDGVGQFDVVALYRAPRAGQFACCVVEDGISDEDAHETRVGEERARREAGAGSRRAGALGAGGGPGGTAAG